MPSANGVLKTIGRRYNPLNRALVQQFRKDTGLKVTYEQFREIVFETCALMQDAIINDEAGLELPYRMGNIVVTKYKSKKEPKDWVNTHKLKSTVPLLNLHSFGYIYHIKWFKMGARFRNAYIYKFQPIRIVRRSVAKNIKSGKLYHHWENTDFWSTTKMERMFDKFFKPKGDNDHT